MPEERASVVLVTDHSGSMEAKDVEPSRLEAARSAADRFLERVPDELRVGIVAFNHAVRAIESPTTDRHEVRRVVDRMRSSGGTATGEGLATALALLDRQTKREGKRAPAAIVLLSDGAATHGRDPMGPAQEAARARIPVYTVALGTPEGTIEVRVPGGGTARRRVPPDRATLERLAIDTVYERLGSQVATRPEKREISAAFAAGAALFLAGGGMLSLGWFARLP